MHIHHISIRMAAICLAALCLVSGAQASILTLQGEIVPSRTAEVYAPIGGVVEEVLAEEGQAAGTETPLYRLRTEKVYAPESGTVTGIFAQPGDLASNVEQRYGALLYLEEDWLYTVSASTDTAANSTEMKLIHVGEIVYLVCRTNAARNGEGVVTAVSGTGYTVEVSEGNFMPGDSVAIYRDEQRTTAQKIGQGTVSRRSPTAITGSGSLAVLRVKDGDHVSKGDVLLETLDGAFDGFYMSGSEITSGTDGVIAALRLSQGASVQKGSVVAQLYPSGAMRVEASLPEDDYRRLATGQEVTVALSSDEDVTFPGIVTMISLTPTGDAGDTAYRVLVDFAEGQDLSVLSYGMSVLVMEQQDEDEPETEEPEEEAPQEEPSREDSGRETRRNDGALGTEDGERQNRRRNPQGDEVPSGEWQRNRNGQQETESADDTVPAEEPQEDQGTNRNERQIQVQVQNREGDGE
ncbi:MAG: HlyD family efflux transporter periplasmic adaptor subunit [Clostridia bacterium]|nr:HlyD family efflux transporter periplasmic adaptor subunit [Clostridia bacterium]